MGLERAVEADITAVVTLANLAYRGGGAVAGWCTEADLIEGTRLTEDLLREDLAGKPEARLMLWRDQAGGPVLGTVWLEPRKEGIWYLGLLTVRPELQDRGMGRQLLQAGEECVRELGGRRVRIAVLHLRDTLIAWYERRGYVRTGETEPFPYEDERFGRPQREGLYFVVLEKAIEPLD